MFSFNGVCSSFQQQELLSDKISVYMNSLEHAQRQKKTYGIKTIQNFESVKQATRPGPRLYVRQKKAAMQGYLGFKNDLCWMMGRNTVLLCVTRCMLCLWAASLRLRFERKKKNARDRKWKKNRDKPPSSSCSPPSAHDHQGADNNAQSVLVRF